MSDLKDSSARRPNRGPKRRRPPEAAPKKESDAGSAGSANAQPSSWYDNIKPGTRVSIAEASHSPKLPSMAGSDAGSDDDAMPTGFLAGRANTMAPYSTPTLPTKSSPPGVVAAARYLEARRYCPTSSEHGLAWRLKQDAATSPGRSPVKPGTGQVEVGPFQKSGVHGHSTRWKDRAKYPPDWFNDPGGSHSYKDIHPESATFGLWYDHKAAALTPWRRPPGEELDPRKTTLARSTSEPGTLIDGVYRHENPFMSYFKNRGPGGSLFGHVHVSPGVVSRS
eukprot:gnl/TRDRNA2_/TRDRNA2_184201_c0_seq1.p1 gnl/TRDRNA2_/TRDRNA2_184201_c0~~gnl/TRDRNA2_/TRDRNA2_184201_c0_seq1.p1  ORF type:complete len:300 (-),score=22.56 gnl/TRDRNA2_/TRDRNA2_184201_c0_seq1:96-935(-)